MIKILHFRGNRINKLHLHEFNVRKKKNGLLGEEWFITLKFRVYTQIVIIYNLAIE